MKGPTKAERQDWQAQDDARYLMYADQVKKDPARHKRAKVKMKEMLQEKEAEIKVIKSLARGK